MAKLQFAVFYFCFRCLHFACNFMGGGSILLIINDVQYDNTVLSL